MGMSTFSPSQRKIIQGSAIKLGIAYAPLGQMVFTDRFVGSVNL